MPKGPSKRCAGPCGLVKPISAFQNKGGGNRRATCGPCRALPAAPPPAPKRYSRPLDSKVYIITSAQNATPVDDNFLATLKVAAAAMGAELVVVPFRYKNPTSIWNKNNKDNEWWGIHPAREARGEVNPLEPFLFNVRKKLNPNLVLAADVKMQPTASSPVSGFEGLTGAESCIFGHPKMQLRVIASPTGKYPKILTTTGACTRKNFTDSKAGKLGAFHHCLGALIVEQRGKKFHLRQINASHEDGSFTDLDQHYSPMGVTKAPPALGLVMGDIHVRFTSPDVERATFGPGGMVEVLNPEWIVVHDGLDGDTMNPHQKGDPFLAEARRKAGKSSVRDEVQETVDWVKKRAQGRKAAVVASNHHDFFQRWILATDWKQDIKNAEFYLETALMMFRSAELTPHGGEYTDPFTYWMGKMDVGDNVKCLGPDESFRLAGIECGMHGNRGPNGSRGSLKNLSRLGAKVISGHTHTPGIEEGHYQVGTSSYRRLNYTHGPSSWLNTHCVVYATGKRALLTIIDGAWRI